MVEDLTALYTFVSDSEMRDNNLTKSLESIDGLIPDENVLIINHGNEHEKWDEYRERYRIINLPLPYSQGYSKNVGMLNVETDFAFHLDADMIVLPNFFDNLKLEKGSVYYPMCFSLYKDKPAKIHEENGWWRNYGWGMAIFHKEDFQQYGPFINNTSWGSEDTELLKRIRPHLKVVRWKAPLIHLWHNDSPEFKNRFYKK